MNRRAFLKAALAGTLRAVLPGAPLVLGGPVGVPHWDGPVPVVSGLVRGRQILLSTPMAGPNYFYELVKQAQRNEVHNPTPLVRWPRGITSVLDGKWSNG